MVVDLAVDVASAVDEASVMRSGTGNARAEPHKIHTMKPEACLLRFSGYCCLESRLSQAAGGHFPALQTHSCQRALIHSHSFSTHPQVAQGKQRDKFHRVLGQPFVPNLDETELTLDHPKQMHDLGADAGLELLGFVQQTAPRQVLLQRPALDGAHG